MKNLLSLVFLLSVGHAQTTVNVVQACPQKTIAVVRNTVTIPACPVTAIKLPAGPAGATGKQGIQGVPGPATPITAVTITLTCNPAAFVQAKPPVQNTITIAGLQCQITQVTPK